MPVNPGKIRRASRPVSEILDTGSAVLGQLLRHARKLDRLEKALAGILEPGIAENVRVMAVHGERLVVLTHSAALATRLRMDSESIVAALNAAGQRAIKQLEARTGPLPRALTHQRKKRELPRAGRKSLERFAKDSGEEGLLALLRGKKSG